MSWIKSSARFLCRAGIVLALAVVLVESGQARDDDPLAVHVGQSRMLRLDEPVASVFVADPAIADVQVVSPQVLFVFGRAVGHTSVAALASDGVPMGRWKVTVALDMEPVRAALSGDAALRGVEVRQWQQGVELSGAATSTEAAARALQLVTAALPENAAVINRVSVSNSHQVNLEVQIAEVQRSVSESLGINWEAFSLRGDGLFGFRVGRFGFIDPADGAFVGTSLPEGPASALYGGTSNDSGSASVRGLIDALASAGLATVLARPNLTAVSGETASFFSGGEYPLPSGFEQGRLIFTYKRYGVLLDFVPTVINEQRIALTVRPEVSQRAATDSLKILDAEIPVINVRRAETTIEVGNGESIVIAGLYRNQSESTESGVPGLKDIPKLGALFGNRAVRSNSTELIVVVTARLVGATRVAADGAGTDDEGERVANRRIQGYHY